VRCPCADLRVLKVETGKEDDAAGPRVARHAFVFASTWFVNMRLLGVGAPYAYPMNSAILVLLRET
jgi:hypothetical protein